MLQSDEAEVLAGYLYVQPCPANSSRIRLRRERMLCGCLLCSLLAILRSMLELILVLLSLVVIGLIGLLAIVITPPRMVELGLWGLALGLFIGIPAGWWYHVVLYRALAVRMALPPRWWRRPVDLHPLLAPEEYRRVRPWFVAGALGFFLCLTGGVAAITGMLLIRFYP